MSELKAKVLLGELNRRSKLLAVLRGNHDPWFAGAFITGLMTLLAAILVYQSFDSAQAIAILVLVVALCGIMDIHTQSVHKRVDALVALLRQDGMLGNGLSASRQAQSPKNPLDNERADASA